MPASDSILEWVCTSIGIVRGSVCECNLAVIDNGFNLIKGAKVLTLTFPLMLPRILGYVKLGCKYIWVTPGRRLRG